MSKSNAPKQRRSFRVVFKIFKFAVAMVLTFFISFAVTLAMKTENPTDVLENAGEEFFSEEPAKSTGAPEIKTLFDEQNNQTFVAESDEKISATAKNSDDERNSTAAKNSDADRNSTAAKNSVDERNYEPARQEENIGIFASFNRMMNVKPAVEDKIRSMPRYIDIDKTPYLLRQAVVAVEDTRFYDHKGFDIIGIARAVVVNVEAGEIQEGGSTITQQTVKNLFLTSDRTFTRKAEELFLARSLEKNFSKDEILELYLNSIYFGSNFYGIRDAAQGYFGKDPADLSIAECAMLAGLPNAPSLYSPYVNFHSAKQRQLVVIDAMEKMGVISKREAESARIEEIILAH